MQDDSIRIVIIHSAFIPVTGLKYLCGKISSPLTEIPGTEPARPLIWTHHIENFAQDLEIWRDLGNQTYVRRPLISLFIAQKWRTPILHDSYMDFAIPRRYFLDIARRNRKVGEGINWLRKLKIIVIIVIVNITFKKRIAKPVVRWATSDSIMKFFLHFERLKNEAFVSRQTSSLVTELVSLCGIN